QYYGERSVVYRCKISSCGFRLEGSMWTYLALVLYISMSELFTTGISCLCSRLKEIVSLTQTDTHTPSIWSRCSFLPPNCYDLTLFEVKMRESPLRKFRWEEQVWEDLYYWDIHKEETSDVSNMTISVLE
ncbi:unnamed protein product, partial [Brassica oleracea var. botrytis]